jgi:cation transport ATPase
MGRPAFTVYRRGGIVSTCEVVSDRPGRIRLNHEDLRRDPALAERVERLLRSVPGVARAVVGWWSGRLSVWYDPGELSAEGVVRLAEEALEGTTAWALALEPPQRTRYALANTTLGVAALADFVLPVLAPVSAGLLVGTNLKTFRAAWLQARGRTFGLPVLYSVIVVTTLASGQFLASALMSWTFRFWQGRLRVDLAAERLRLLEGCLPLPRTAQLVTPAAPDVLVQVPAERLQAGDRVAVGPDEAVPADGRIVEGEAIVDERSVRGLEGASRKRVGDSVLAGSTVLSGSVRVEVTRPAGAARASAIGRSLVAATSPDPAPHGPTRDAEAFAARTVGPTLATAGVGLLVGDLTAAAAILRPDYATGPGVAVPLEALRDAAACVARGIIPLRFDAFARLAAADLIVLEDGPALRRPALEVADVVGRLTEDEILRYAASAYRHIADDRATALADACRARRVHRLDLPPAGFGPGVTVAAGNRLVRVVEREPGQAGALGVEVDGQAVGTVEFAWSRRLEAAEAVARLKSAAAAPVVLVSAASESEVAARARALGVDHHHAGLGPDELARLLADGRARGLRAAFVGDCSKNPGPAAEAHVAVSLGGEGAFESEDVHAAVVLLQPRLDRFADLWDVAQRHTGRARRSERFMLVPNLLCVVGALLFGVTSLTAVVVSNLGTFGLYSRAVGPLRELEPGRRGRPSRPRPRGWGG